MGNIEITTYHSAVLNTVSSEAMWDDIALHAVSHAPEWKGKNVIWDMNAFDFTTLTAEDIRSFIEGTKEVSEWRKGTKDAIMCEPDFGYGMMRMFTIMAERNYKQPVEAVRTLEEAKVWFAES